MLTRLFRHQGFSVDCLKSLAQLDFLWAPKYTDLTPNLVEYHAEIAPSSPVSYVVFAGFWEDQQTVPEDFLEALDTIRDRAKSVVIIGVPRVRLCLPHPTEPLSPYCYPFQAAVKAAAHE